MRTFSWEGSHKAGADRLPLNTLLPWALISEKVVAPVLATTATFGAFGKKPNWLTLILSGRLFTTPEELELLAELELLDELELELEELELEELELLDELLLDELPWPPDELPPQAARLTQEPIIKAFIIFISLPLDCHEISLPAKFTFFNIRGTATSSALMNVKPGPVLRYFQF